MIKHLLKNRIVILIVSACLLVLSACGGSSDSASSDGVSSDSGKGGSLARFMVVDNTLYTIAGAELKLLYISDPSTPVLWQNVYIGFDIETLFSYGDALFVGSQTGVHIFDNTNPAFPEYVTQFIHARSCDPVVVQGNYAYVTLRSNNRCWGTSNQLDIIDVGNITAPFLVKTYNMIEPKGLGIDAAMLFVCDGRAGLKVFGVADPLNLTVLETQPSIVCNDVIPNSGTLLVTADNGLYQYDYNSLPMSLLSTIRAM